MKKLPPRQFVPMLAEHVSWWGSRNKAEKEAPHEQNQELKRKIADIIGPCVQQAFDACGRSTDDPDGWRVVCVALAVAVFLNKAPGRPEITTAEDKRLIKDVDDLIREGRKRDDCWKILIEREPYSSMVGRRAKGSASIGKLTARGLRSRYYDAKKRIAKDLFAI